MGLNYVEVNGRMVKISIRELSYLTAYLLIYFKQRKESEIMQTRTRLLSVMLVFVMIISMVNIPVFGAESAAAPAAEFKNITEDGGKDIISLSSERTFEVIIPLGADVTKEEAEQILATAKWSLTREAGMQTDTERFPNQYLGADLEDWKVWGKDEPLFTSIEMNGVKKGDSLGIRMTFSNAYFFGGPRVDSPRGNRNVILDYTGEYTLSCKDGNGNVIGQTTVRVNPYDDYRTNSELAAELAAAKLYIDGRDDMYAELLSLGTSTNGYDMPYIIIADSKATLDKYQEIKKIAEKDPKSLMDQIAAGTLEYKVPILYSNIHADENPGADAPINFVWDLALSDTTDDTLSYKILTDFTAEGKAQFDAEMEAEGIHWSSLIADYATGLGFVKGEGKTASGPVDIDKYYTTDTVDLKVSELLNEVFFIVVPAENVDGRTYNIRQNGNGFDINRDNMFQTQIETQLMTKMIANWNPASFIELHGFVGGFQVEPCSPPHEPNIEYDLFAEHGFKGGEAFGNAAVANNDTFNSYTMPLRDYLTSDEDGNPYWEYPWDDMSTNYTPQYSLLHGTLAYTIEVPQSNQGGTTALEYGLIGHAKYIADNKDAIFTNQLTGYLRGIKNTDVAEIRDWYVDMNDNIGAEADVYRPVYADNNNFFPECYIIPVDAESQKNLDAAYAMQEFLIRNGVTVHKLKVDVKISGVTYKAGSFVVSMYQAKRNVANGALYDGALITGWTELYSEPITAFSQTRGFDCVVITKNDAYRKLNANMTVVTEAEAGKTSFTGTENADVIIMNNSVASIAAVNALLKSGAKVGFITDGKYDGNFVTSYNNFLTVKDIYVLTAVGVNFKDAARTITKSPTIFIPGAAAEFALMNDVAYGVKNYSNYGNTNLNFDRFAYGKQMGFTISATADEADMIAGNRALSGAALEAVLAGKPYLGAGVSALNSVQENVLADTGFVYDGNGGGYDALFFATYETESIITDVYAAANDNIMYGFGGGYIAEIPEGAEILIKATTDEPLEGFFFGENLEKFLGTIQAITYKTDSLDLTLFANSLTSKAHQQDDYRYASNTIFSKFLGADYSEKSYADVSADAWYADAVAYVTTNNYISGVSDTEFAPNGDATVGLFIELIAGVTGLDTSLAQALAVKAGIVEKSTDMSTPLTRENLCVILVKFIEEAGLSVTVDADSADFADIDTISADALESVIFCQQNGIVNGREDGTFAPLEIATRAQVAQVLMNLFN